MTSHKPHILVVDDDRFVRELVEIYLAAEGYRATTVADGEAMREVMSRDPAQLVIMDLKLPGADGLTLTRYLRANYDVGIVILTTHNDAVDRVIGLDCGADDYVTKPFDQRELMARIRSVLRRVTTPRVPVSATPAALDMAIAKAEIMFHGYRLDLDNMMLVSPHGEKVLLTDYEAQLLSHLARNTGKIMSRDMLMDLVMHRSRDPLDRSIDILVTRVRRKIEPNPRRPAVIKTVRGSGYVIPTNTQANAA